MDGSWSTAHESTEIESYRWAIVGPDSVEIWAQDEIKASYTFPDSLIGDRIQSLSHDHRWP